MDIKTINTIARAMKRTKPKAKASPTLDGYLIACQQWEYDVTHLALVVESLQSYVGYNEFIEKCGFNKE